MKKPLLDVLFASKKRKDALLLLQEGPQEMEYLLKSLDTTRQALLPQIKILKEHQLVFEYDDSYELTSIGKLLVDYIKPLVGTLETFDTDIDFWGTRDLDFIPSHLLKEIGCLDKCGVIYPELIHIYDAHKSYHETCAISNSLFAVTTFVYPDFYEMFTRFIASNIKSTIVMSPSLYNQLKTERYSHFKQLLNSDLMCFFLYPEEMNFLSFGYNDYQFVMTPLKNKGEFDIKHLLCSSNKAREWGKKLCDYYFKDSTPVTEIY
ncbi:MAG: winged helix-turn-helix domain-containing protein [Methanosarcinaceae archaeon]|nr:winged helix-turn-helix domain-containing protein [Methanosarcinaceae archaeon]